MCKSSRVAALTLVVDNSQQTHHRERLHAKAAQAYWRDREDAAVEFLVPLRTGSPRGLAEKAQILEDMVETRRPAEQVAVFAAAIADEALSISRSYLSRAN